MQTKTNTSLSAWPTHKHTEDTDLAPYLDSAHGLQSIVLWFWHSDQQPPWSSSCYCCFLSSCVPSSYLHWWEFNHLQVLAHFIQDTKSIFMMTSIFFLSNQLLKSGKKGNKEKPGERRGHKHGKRRGRVEGRWHFFFTQCPMMIKGAFELMSWNCMQSQENTYVVSC